MNETKKNSYLIKVLVFVVALVVLGISTTYAYFTLNIIGTPKQSTAKAGTLNVETNLDKVAAISDAKFSLIKSTEKNDKAPKVEFYIKNTSTAGININYYIYLTEINVSKNFYSPYFKWELVKQDGTVINNGDFSSLKRKGTETSGEKANVSTEAEKFLLNKSEGETPTPVTLANGKTDNLIFRMWLENDDKVDQISLTEGSFSAKLFYEAVPVK